MLLDYSARDSVLTTTSWRFLRMSWASRGEGPNWASSRVNEKKKVKCIFSCKKSEDVRIMIKISLLKCTCELGHR